MFRPSTKTRFFFGSTALTVPVLPLSLPVITLTVSPLRIFSRCGTGYRASRAGPQQTGRDSGEVTMVVTEPPGWGPQQTGRDSGEVTMLLKHLRRERNDLHEVAVAQLAGDRAEDARAARVVGGVDDHGGVLVERDVGAVLASELLLGPDDDRGDHFPLLDVAVGDRLLDRGDDRVADAGVAALRAAANADAEDLTRTRVVGHAQACLGLDHLLRSSTSVRRQRLVFDIGRVSITRTRSPSFASLRSSCACSVDDSRMIFLYMR